MTTTEQFDSIQPIVDVDSGNKIDSKKKGRKWLGGLLTLAIIKMLTSDPAIGQETITQERKNDTTGIVMQQDSTRNDVVEAFNLNNNDLGDATGGGGELMEPDPVSPDSTKVEPDSILLDTTGIVPDSVLPDSNEGELAGIEPDPVCSDDAELKPADSGSNEDNNSNVTITGGFGVLNCAFTPVSGGIVSNNTTYSGYLNIVHKSGFGGTISRVDDFGDPAGSRFTKLGVTFNKKFGLPENLDINLKGDISYVCFDNTFIGNNGEELNLNEFMCVAEIDFKKGEKYFLNLSYLYNAFLNGETPHNMVTKLKAGVNLSKKTTLYSDLWYKHVVNGQNNFSVGIGMEQKLWEGFVVWTEALFREGGFGVDGCPKRVIGLKKDFKF